MNLEAFRMRPDDPERWMRIAFAEAEFAAKEGEVPVGAIIVQDGIILGKGHNRNKALCDPTAHAEILAITAACTKLETTRLENADLYVTLEPCPMCAGAIVLARIKRLFFGCFDPKSGACGSLFDVVRDPRLNHRVEVYSGILADESSRMLEGFFNSLRDNKSNVDMPGR